MDLTPPRTEMALSEPRGLSTIGYKPGQFWNYVNPTLWMADIFGSGSKHLQTCIRSYSAHYKKETSELGDAFPLVPLNFQPWLRT
jgi:hypothetical protein